MDFLGLSCPGELSVFRAWRCRVMQVVFNGLVFPALLPLPAGEPAVPFGVRWPFSRECVQSVGTHSLVRSLNPGHLAHNGCPLSLVYLTL